MPRLTTRTRRAGGALALLLGLGLGARTLAAAQPPAALVEYYHLDALGSVRLVTDQSGQIVRRHDYLPFGEEWLPPATPSDPFRFTGKPRDGALDYFGARYYSPRTGRFTTVDPLMAVDDGTLDPQRWHRYGYAANNPFRYIDPDGRGILTKLAKLILKGGDVAATTAGIVEDVQTLTDENASVRSRLLAAASLGSEFLPVSVRDVREGGEFALSVVQSARQLETARTHLLRQATDPRLRHAIDQLYRKGAELGSGSTMDAVRLERASGTLLTRKGHIPKLVERRTNLLRLLRDRNLADTDKQIIRELLRDIQAALGS
jgi:RHS repeat-associated protein